MDGLTFSVNEQGARLDIYPTQSSFPLVHINEFHEILVDGILIGIIGPGRRVLFKAPPACTKRGK